jgi:hypothetical protein
MRVRDPQKGIKIKSISPNGRVLRLHPSFLTTIGGPHRDLRGRRKCGCAVHIQNAAAVGLIVGLPPTITVKTVAP